MNTTLSHLWNAVIAELECATDRYNVTVEPAGHHGDYKADEDEKGMRDCSDADLIAWVDDLEDRVGMDVESMRDAIKEFTDARAKVGTILHENTDAPEHMREAAQQVLNAWRVAVSADGDLDAIHNALKEKARDSIKEHTGGNIWVAQAMIPTLGNGMLFVSATEDSIEICISAHPDSIVQSAAARWEECGEWTPSLLLEACI